MSDQVRHVDIDDVLSSIRKLVSEGERKKASVLETHSDADPAPDKLLLTPNFRVKEGEPPAKTEAEAEPEAQASDSSDPVASEPPRLLLTPEQSVPANDSAPEIKADSLSSLAAEFETRVTGAKDQWEPDGSEAVAEPTWTSAAFAAKPRDGAPAEPEPKKEPPLRLAAVQSEPADPAPAEDVPGHLGFFARARSERWSEHAEKLSTPPVVDDPDTDYGDELMQTGPLAEDEALDAYLNGVPAIDEAALRRIVQEVVREELQGKLGERITRNVRKLVRREIHNILTTQEFD